LSGGDAAASSEEAQAVDALASALEGAGVKEEEKA